MTEHPADPPDGPVLDDPPEAGTEVDDQPLGVPEDEDPDEAPLPGLPEGEPPVSG